jgi:hypothetical protein
MKIQKINCQKNEKKGYFWSVILKK